MIVIPVASVVVAAIIVALSICCLVKIKKKTGEAGYDIADKRYVEQIGGLLIGT